MFKQSIALIAGSIIIIVSMAHAQQAIQLLLDAHNWIADILMSVFSGDQAGNLIRGLIALLAMPILIGLIPATIYWMLRRHWFPYFMEIVWVVWLIQVGALVVMYKAII